MMKCWELDVVMVAHFCDYTKTTEMYRLKEWIFWLVNYASIKPLKINLSKKTIEVGIMLRFTAEHNSKREMEVQITPTRRSGRGDREKITSSRGGPLRMLCRGTSA